MAEQWRQMKATHIVHWPGEDVPACETHMLQLRGIARAMGYTVSTTDLVNTNVDCSNCVKEKGRGVIEQPVDAEKMRHIEARARALAGVLDQATNDAFKNKRLGFALFIFSFEGAELTYISNAEREMMVKVLAEFIAANPPAMTWDEQHG